MTARLFVFVAAVLSSAVRLLACTCGELTICERLDKIPVIFLGEVIEDAGPVRLKVIEAFRSVPNGALEMEVQQFSLTNCDPSPYVRGRRILVFAHLDSNGRATDGPCTLSITGKRIPDALATTRSYFRKEMKTSILGKVAFNVFPIDVELAPPIAGATILAQSSANSYRAISDANGNYAISGIVAGDYTVRAERDGLENRDPHRSARVREGSCSIKHFGLWTKNSVSGFVRDANGAPARNLDVFLKRAGSARNDGKNVTTDANGRFEFVEIDPGEQTVIVSFQGATVPSPYSKTTSTPLKVGTTSRITGVTLTLPSPIPIRNIRVHVTGRDDKPFTKGYISCRQIDPKGKGDGYKETTSARYTGADCRALSDRPYRIQLEHRGRRVSRIVPAGNKDVVLRLRIP